MTTSAAKEVDTPLKGLYDFVKAHLVIVNGVVAASITVVGVLDFLAPTLAILPRVVYTGTAGLVVLMLLTAFAPLATTRLLALAGAGRPLKAGTPQWRRPAWQFGVALLLATTALGFLSMAKAAQGGAIASTFPAARSLQESMLGLRQDVAGLKTGVATVISTVDRIASAVDPANVADRCTDLECAVEQGASAAAVRRLFAKGAHVPGDPLHDGWLVWQASLSDSPDRLDVIDLLRRHGIAADVLFLPTAQSKAQVSTPGLATAREIVDLAALDQATKVSPSAERFLPQRRFSLTGNPDAERWNSAMGCLLRSSGGVSLMELAALQGDAPLYAHLRERGDVLPQRALRCAGWRAGSGAVVRIDPASGQVHVAGGA